MHYRITEPLAGAENQVSSKSDIFWHNHCIINILNSQQKTNERLEFKDGGKEIINRT